MKSKTIPELYLHQELMQQLCWGRQSKGLQLWCHGKEHNLVQKCDVLLARRSGNSLYAAQNNLDSDDAEVITA